MTTFSHFDSPLGPLVLAGEDGALVRLGFAGTPIDPSWRHDDASLAEVRAQLAAYFAGELRDFDLRLAAHGTPFEEGVWDALCRIPYGTTVSYSELAVTIGAPRGARAVGQANGRNPIAIIVPCHRVIASGGGLGGYGGGLPAKRLLLDLENRVAVPRHAFALA